MEAQLNTEKLKEDFARVGFSVKVVDRLDGQMFRLEYSPLLAEARKDDALRLALRQAIKVRGGFVCTYYEDDVLGNGIPVLLCRDRVDFPYTDEADLKGVLNDVMDGFNKIHSTWVEAGRKEHPYRPIGRTVKLPGARA